MVTLEEAAALAASLPGVTVGERWRNRSWSVGKNAFAWERPLTKADVKRLGGAPVPQGPLLALRCADLHETQAVLAEGHRGFFTIAHFKGYPALLVQLDEADPDELREALLDAWRACAPPDLTHEEPG